MYRWPIQKHSMLQSTLCPWLPEGEKRAKGAMPLEVLKRAI